MNWQENFTERELKEIEFSRIYARDFAHGTDGHNSKTIISKLVVLLEAPPTTDEPMDADELLRYIRSMHGTQNEIASELGVSVSYLSLLLNGHREANEAVLESLKLKRVLTYIPI